MNAGLLQWYIALLIMGVLLLGAEVYVPGGVLGALGGLALAGAMVIGFGFGWPGGLISAAGIVLFGSLGVYLWVRFFPKTGIGRRMTLERKGNDFTLKRADLQQLVGRNGRTLSPLRPSGLGLIDGRRYDVMTRGHWVDAGQCFRVVAVEGTRIIVEANDDEPGQGAPS